MGYQRPYSGGHDVLATDDTIIFTITVALRSSLVEDRIERAMIRAWLQLAGQKLSFTHAKAPVGISILGNGDHQVLR